MLTTLLNPAPALPVDPGSALTWDAPEQPEWTRRFIVEVRDANRLRVGSINPASLTFTERLNDVGEWSLTVAEDDLGAPLLWAPGAGVLIFDADDPATPLMTGPVATRTRTLSGGRQMFEVSGLDDNKELASREAYQEPTLSATTQLLSPSGAVYDTRSGPAEAVIKEYVSVNAGQAAIPERRKVNVIPAGSTPLGGTVVGKARMEPGLLPLIQGLAETGNVGFRVRQSANSSQLVFDVFERVNRSGYIRFGLPFGNLDEVSYTETAPSVSYVITGASGLGTSRTFRDMLDDEALTKWPGWRQEQYVDQANTIDAGELDQAMREALLEGGPTVSITCKVTDTPLMRLWRDFGVGDRVAVVFPAFAGTEETVTDVIREVTVTSEVGQAVQVAMKVGSRQATGTDSISRRLRALKRQVNDVNTVD